MSRFPDQPPARTPADVRAAICEAATDETMAAFATSPAVQMRKHAARSPWLTRDLALQLSRSKSERVRAALAGNPTVDPDILERLTRDRRLLVRTAAAGNRSCPYAAAAAAEDAAPLAHPDAPAHLVAAAVEQRRGRDEALRHPNLPEESRRRVVAEAASAATCHPLWVLLENPATTHEQALEVIAATPAGQESVSVWQWAEHPAADPDWLAQVADQYWDSAGIVAHLAGNPATPPVVLERIATEHVHRDDVLTNPGCPPQLLLALLLERHRDPDRRSDPVRQRTRCADVAVNPAADLTVLAHLDARHVTGTARWWFTAHHATRAAQAHTMLELLGSWSGTLADLVEVSAAATLPPR